MLRGDKNFMNTRRINPILYFLIVYIGGIFGIHYFVDGNNKKGVLYLCTLGYCGIGWLIDLVKAFILIFNASAYQKKPMKSHTILTLKVKCILNCVALEKIV